MTSGCSSGVSHGDEAQWMGELLEELAAGGGAEDGVAGEQLGCTGSSCSKKRMRHINNERQRRILMNNLLDSLQSLLPDPHPRKDRCALLTEVIAYVRSLEEEIQDLAARTTQMKRAKPRVGRTASDSTPSDNQVTTNLKQVHVQLIRPYAQAQAIMEGSELPSMGSNRTEEVVITFASLPTRGMLPQVLALFQNSQIEVINATLSTTPTDAQMLYYIHARVPKEDCLQTNDLKSLFSHMTFQDDDITYHFTI